MQQRVVVNNGKRYIVNTVGWEDGVGAGFPLGALVMKSITDKFWYIIYASGSANDVSASVSQSALSFPTESYFDQNYPYQLLGFDATSSYVVYLSGSAPNTALVVSQSRFTGSSEPKPSLLLQNITDGNYYTAYLSASAGAIGLFVNQTMVSASWVNPIY